MDISNLASAYAGYADQVSGTSSAESYKNKIENTDFSNATDEELMEACKSFEAYFIEMMYKEMMKTVPKSEFSSGANSTLVDYYKDELVKNISEQTSEQSNMGLAQALYEQMKRNYEV
ncbi:MAG: rod-binding protein [Lachnospiraceae bacterium]|nr:rod-binding protein [Lachnospiraceae bacterium]